MKIEQAKQIAQDMYQELYPSALAFFCVQRETETKNPDTQFEARFLLCLIAIRLYQEAIAEIRTEPPIDRMKMSHDLMKLATDSQNQEATTLFWLTLGLAEVESFETAYRRQATDAITLKGNLSLEEEAAYMPQ